MVAGGATAAAGRFFPALAFGRDPVLVGTAVNALVLAGAFAAAAGGRGAARPAGA